MKFVTFILAFLLLAFSAVGQLPVSVRSTNGTAVNLTASGTFSGDGSGLNPATTSRLGPVKPDGISITVDGSGIISAPASGAASNILAGAGVTVTPSAGNATVAVDGTVVRTSQTNNFVQTNSSGVTVTIGNSFSTFTGIFSGNGSALTALNGANITSGTVNSNALDAATKAQLALAGSSTGSNITGLDPIVVTPSAGNAVVSFTGSTTNQFARTNGTGPITAGVFNGSGSGLTALPASQLTGALPAISGTALTALPAFAVTTNGSGQTVYQPLNLYGSIITLSNNVLLLTNSVLQLGTPTGNPVLIAFGDATNNQKFTITLNTTHGGGQPNGDSSELQNSGNNWSLDLEGHGQFGKIGAANLTAYYISRWRDASVSVPFTTSHVSGYQFAYYNGGENISQMSMQAVPQDTNGNVNLQFYDAPPPGSDVTNVTSAPRFAVKSGVGTQTWGATVFDVQTVAVGSNSTLYLDLYHRFQDVRLNGPVTVALTNLGLLNATNENTSPMDVWLNPGLIGNCPITWNFGATVVTNWEGPFGSIPAPTNCPANSILHFTFIPLIRDGVTNLTCSYQMENFTPTIDTTAATFFAAIGASLFPQESNQVNYVAKDLKKWNVFTNWDAWHPMVGGTSNSCSWNLIDPTKWRYAWTLGSSTFGPLGWLSDGSASFGNSGFNPATATTPKYVQDSATMLMYCGTASPTYTSQNCFMGAVGGSVRSSLAMGGTLRIGYDGFNDGQFFLSSTAAPSLAGTLAVSRTGPTLTTIYAPGVTLADPQASTGVPNATIFIGAANNGGIYHPVAAQYETTAWGSAINATQEAQLAAILTLFNQGLNR